MLKIQNISKSFEGRRVLDDVTFELAGGETLLLLGLNGAGKTTLLSLIAGGLRPDGGNILVAGRDVHRDRTARACIGVAGHETMLHPGLTVRESLEWFARVLGVIEPKLHIADLANWLGIESILDRRAGKLSRGEGQRAAIARAMVGEPEILLLDEPFSGLDVRGREQLGTMLGSLCSPGRVIVLTTHDTDLGLQFATHVAALEGNHITGPLLVKDGEPLFKNFRVSAPTKVG